MFILIRGGLTDHNLWTFQIMNTSYKCCLAKTMARLATTTCFKCFQIPPKPSFFNPLLSKRLWSHKPVSLCLWKCWSVVIVSESLQIGHWAVLLKYLLFFFLPHKHHSASWSAASCFWSFPKDLGSQHQTWWAGWGLSTRLNSMISLVPRPHSLTGCTRAWHAHDYIRSGNIGLPFSVLHVLRSCVGPGNEA